MVVGCIDSERLLRRCAKTAPAACDWVEVRLDLTGLCGGDWIDLCAAVQRRGRPVLLTIRAGREGGAWRGREAERQSLYLEALRSVTAVDVEIQSGGLCLLAEAAHACGVRVVGSFHDFKATPSLDRLQALEARGREKGADVVKIAATVRNRQDLARLFALPALAKGPVAVLGMGPRGAVARVALPCAGSCLTYGSLGAATAPGQPTCRELSRDLKRFCC